MKKIIKPGLLNKVRQLFRVEGAFVVSLLIAGLWLASHPYRGLTHDARLYSIQALSHLYPNIFQNDIFFMYGSQDDYTLFSRLYAYLIGWLGLENAMRVVVGVGHLIWLYASWRISALLFFPKRLVFLALLVTLPGAYATSVFSYGEMFATARIIAEALTLASLAATLAGRPYLACMLLLLAVTQHPLMAFGGILLLALFWSIYILPKVSLRHIFVAVVILLVVTSLIFNFTNLFWRLVNVMDSEWLALIRQRNSYIFVSTWPLRDWNLLVLNFCLLAAAWYLNRDVLSRLFLAGLMLGLMAFLAIGITDQFWHSQLLIQAQPMRAFWLIKWLAVLAFASLLSFRENGHWVPLLFFAAWFAQDNIGGLIATAAFILSVRQPKQLPFSRLIWLVPIVAVLSWIIAKLAAMSLDMGDIAEQAPNNRVMFMSFNMGDLAVLFGAFMVGVVIFLWRQHNAVRASQRFHALLVFSAFSCFGFGLFHFMYNSAKPQLYFSGNKTEYLPKTFSSKIPNQAIVYWQDDIVKTWFLLGRSSYYSKVQSAGALFSRLSTMEMKRRADSLAVLGVRDSIWPFHGADHSPLFASEIHNGLYILCNHEPVDFVILNTKFSDWQVANWVDPMDQTSWWLYDCNQLKHIANDINSGLR